MKTRIFLLALSMMFAVALQAQTYNQLWKRVEQMEQKDLPKTVITEAQTIYQKAKAEHNVPQMMKAYLTMMTYRERISPDSLEVDVRGLEEWAASSQTKLTDRAVLYSILGEIMLKDDFEKGNRYIHLSLKDSLKLVDYPVEKLVPMVKTGETSRLYFANNLYDLLARRAIRLWKENQWNLQRENILQTILQTYQSLLHIYKVKNMRSAWLLTALDAYPQADEVQLREWMAAYADLDVCAEVYLRLSERMQHKDDPAQRLVLLREGIKRYPNYNRINALKNEEKEILSPRLDFRMEYAYPEEPIHLWVQHRNLQGFTVKLYQLFLSAESDALVKVGPKTVTKYGKLVGEEHFDLPPTPDYRLRMDTVKMKPLKTGIYYAVAVPDGHRNTIRGALIYVSSLQVLHRALPDNRQEMVVLDKQSGHPVADAQVNVYEETDKGYTLKSSHRTNAEGVVMLSKDDGLRICYQARTSTDVAMPMENAWLGRNDYRPVDKTVEYMNLFTDRSLYRPGQTLHYSGVVYTQKKDLTQVKTGSSYTVTLLNADRQEVTKQEVKTDEFGTFQGSFELPKSGKMGIYRLQTELESTTFRIEEYKRPTFDVKLEEVNTAYRAGNSIRVTGIARTFAGAPVQDAKVRYQVVRREGSLWRIRGTVTNRVQGETKTDAEGRFEVPVHFLPVSEEERYWFETYEVLVDVTNVAGETQSGSLNLPLGSSSLRLFIPDWEGATLVKEQPKELTFLVTNLMGTPIETEVDYQVWSQSKLIVQGKTISNKGIVPETIYGLPSGSYQLKAVVTDEFGKKNEQTVNFVLLSLDDNRLPDGVENWCYQSNDEFDADGAVTFYFGSKERDVYLFCDVMWGDNQMERKRISFSDSILTFRYTYRETYGDGIRCNFAYLKNGELYVRDLYVKKPKPDKALQLKWKTFRDKLQPGQRETWRLSILRPDGKPADAQLMATMYDASLDQLTPHDWRFGLNFVRSFPNIYWRYERERQVWWNFSFSWKRLKYSPLEYSRLVLPMGNSVVFEEKVMPIGRPMLMKASANRAMVTNDVAVVESAQADMDLEETSNVQIRTNMAETAFFYPQLRTDAQGEVDIEFTLPESLTEWKFMGLAHTKDMDYGSIIAKAVASKEFMLQPNLPRFVRVGDEVNVAASLVNLSDKDIQGIARMELFVPETEKVVLAQKCPFEAKASETVQISFGFKVSDKYEGLAVRMIAEGGSFSDGEQRYLPVLSNKQKLTESVLLNVKGKGTYTFSLESLFNQHSKTVSRPKMVVEFTGNPLWYAVQALNVLENPKSDNALSWATAYYANSLLSHLAKTEPRMADSLKLEGVESRMMEAVMKLKDLQGKDGAWSWFKGMSGSGYMTIQITELLARLKLMTGRFNNPNVNGMYQQAWTFLDKKVLKEVNRMKEMEKDGARNLLPSEQAIRYLYIGALDKELSVQSDVKKYLLDKLSGSTRSLTIYGKALVSIIMQQADKQVEADEFLQSLMEYSVMSEEMGCYFDTPKAEYSWFSYKIPTQVMAIEALHRMKKDSGSIEPMKQWLLKQKQAQDWDTPIATSDAVYALLTTGKDWLQHTGGAEIKVGKEIVRTPGDALGYVEKEVSGKVMNIRQVTVKKDTDGIGWGAVYAEFEEDLDKVVSQGNALKVKHTLYKNGQLLPEDAIFQVGDKLTVRLTVTADRDMDFVQVKDERAACMEPVDVLSGYRWNRNIGYYQETKDASTSFYMDQLRKGTHVLEYEVYITSSGRYVQGIATAQSVYAPEFVGHGRSGSMFVK